MARASAAFPPAWEYLTSIKAKYKLSKIPRTFNILRFHWKKRKHENHNSLPLKKQVLKSFFSFNAIASTVNDNSTRTHYAAIFKNTVSVHYTFISLLIYITIPIIFSPSSNIHVIQIIHTTLTIPIILSKNPFIHQINGPMNWRMCWALMQC